MGWPLSSRPAGCSNTDRTGEREPPARPRPAQEGTAMLLRHATPARNLPSIQRAGLLTSKSQGRLPVVWLHAAGKTPWAALHTVRRHGGRVEDVVIIEAD